MVTIPVKTLPILTKFLKENEIVYAKYKVKKIKSAVDRNLSHIDLFKTDDNSVRAWVAEEDYIEALTVALELLVREEEYEYAATAKKVIDTIQINNIIKETAILEE
jgi:protein-arginine kinase activator protein McsA